MKFIKRLFCFHLWIKSYAKTSKEYYMCRFIDTRLLGSYGNMWECSKCGKRISKPIDWIPIQPL